MTAPSTRVAAALLIALLNEGVTDFVLAPGSRSQALALVAAELESAGRVHLRVRIDERDAAFLALGLAKESGRPAVVITTSGSAVSNLQPAVLEGRHSGVPMILLTADRPEELHGIGTNQTTDHVGLLAGQVVRTFDIGAATGDHGEEEAVGAVAREAVAAAVRGPVHINVAFAEPLSSPWTVPPIETFTVGTGLSDGSIDDGLECESSNGDLLVLRPDRRTVVIAGAGAGERAEECARQLGAVLFAEVASGAHFGPQLVVPYRAVAQDSEFVEGLDRVLVFGHPTLSREVPWLVERAALAGVDVIVVRTPGAEDYNPGHSVRVFVDSIEVLGATDEVATQKWADGWVAASRAFLARDEDEPMATSPTGEKTLRVPVTRKNLVDAVWHSTQAADRLVVAASRLIRELDAVAPGKRIVVHANRGLAGLDGTISTAVGVALAHSSGPGGGDAATSRAGVTRLLTGDLAFLHDVGGLALGDGEERPPLLVIVGNDGGGTIFDELEVAQSRRPRPAPAQNALSRYDRVMLTPQTASIELLVRAYGWEYRRVESCDDLDAAISACFGPTVVEVPLAR